MKTSIEQMNRRQFIQQGTGVLVAAAAAASLGRAAAAVKEANPFAYDVERFSKTDPKLIQYEEVSRFACPQPQPRRLAIGPEDRVYLAARNGISILERDGRVRDEISLAAPARCVAVSPEGIVYAGMRDHIEVFDRKGQRLASWEAPGKKAWFTGLAVGANDVFAADSGNRVVLRYDKSGKVAGRIGERNKERNVPGLIVPSPYLDVKLGRDGLLRVNNPGRHCVELYTAEGDLELSWGKPSAAIEGFCGCCNPIGLALLPDGRCLTCEKGLPRVKVHSTEGTFESVVAGPEVFPEAAKAGTVHDLSDGTLGGLDAASDSQGCIYVLDLAGANVRVMRRKV